MHFELGRVVVTPRAAEAIRQAGCALEHLLDRHQCGDWGNISDDLRQLNHRATLEGGNIVSIFPTSDGDAVTILTRADRSLTLVHLSPQPN
jgi:hypothetical protein